MALVFGGRLEFWEPAARIRVRHATASVRAEAQHTAVGRHDDGLPPSRPQVLERWHDTIASPLSDQVDDGLVQLVDGQFRILKRVTDRNNDLFSLLLRQAYAVRKGRVRRDSGQRGQPNRKIISS